MNEKRFLSNDFLPDASGGDVDGVDDVDSRGNRSDSDRDQSNEEETKNKQSLQDDPVVSEDR